MPKVDITVLATCSLNIYSEGSRDVVANDWIERENEIYDQGLKDYKIRLYLNESTKIGIVTYRGTVPTSLGNLTNDDLKIVLNSVFPFYNFSLITISYFRKKYPNYQFIHTGHSLGAATATLVAATNSEPAVGFDSPGVQDIIEKNSDLRSKIRPAVDITIYQSAPNAINSIHSPIKGAKIIKIIFPTDIQEHLDNKAAILRREFFNLMIPPLSRSYTFSLAALAYTMEAHSMANILKGIKSMDHKPDPSELPREVLYPQGNLAAYYSIPQSSDALEQAFKQKDSENVCKMTNVDKINQPKITNNTEIDKELLQHPADTPQFKQLIAISIEPESQKTEHNVNPLQKPDNSKRPIAARSSQKNNNDPKPAIPKHSQTVIENLLMTCFCFNITDASYIAYILASVACESRLGIFMEEQTDQLRVYHWYEPVVIDEKRQDNVAGMPNKTKGGIVFQQLLDSANIIIKALPMINKLIVESELIKKEIYNFIQQAKLLIKTLTVEQQNNLIVLMNKLQNCSVISEQRSLILDILNGLADGVFAVIKDDLYLPAHLNNIASQNDQQLLTTLAHTATLQETETLKLLTNFNNQNSFKAYTTQIKTDINLEKKSKHQIDFCVIRLKSIVMAWLLLRARKANNLGNIVSKDGENFKGRGYIQITGRKNYSILQQRFETHPFYAKTLSFFKYKEKLDLLQTPELAANSIISLAISVGGMLEGLFTGAKLSSFGEGKNFDFFKARKIINGIVPDVAKHAEKLAKQYSQTLVGGR